MNLEFWQWKSEKKSLGSGPKNRVGQPQVIGNTGLLGFFCLIRGFTGVHLPYFLSFSLLNIEAVLKCVPTIYVLSKNKKNILLFFI